MKLTDEQIVTILEEWKERPDDKDTKLRLLAAFVQKVAPIAGITPQGEVISDLMQWANEAHLEQCETCKMADEAIRIFEDMINAKEEETGEAKVN